MNLAIHNLCNQNCIFCQTQKLIHDKIWQETTEDDVLNQIREVARKSGEISFTGGGEVTMLKHLPELIHEAKQLGIQKVSIETNAVLCAYDNYAKKLKESGLDSFVVSLHSHKEQVSDFITQKPGSFRLTIKGINNMAKLGIKLEGVYHTITSLNYRHLREFVGFVKGFGARLIVFSFIRPIKADQKSASITPHMTDVRPYLHSAIDYCKSESIVAGVSAALGIPLCFLDGYEEFSHELLAYAAQGPEDFKKNSLPQKVKGKHCSRCSLDPSCSGVFESYADIYGTEELAQSGKELKKLLEKCKASTS
jgi:pyruvate-formate lyase-activating enzyme